jgi:hypothetical protein
MSAPSRILVAPFVVACLLGAAPHRDPTPRLSNTQRAALYHRWAVEGLTDPTVEGRERAVRNIREALGLEPNDSDHWLVLGQLRVVGEYDGESRACFRRAIALEPRNLSAYLELAAAWKREWLRILDTLAIARAIGVLDTAATLRPRASDPWLGMVPLLYEKRDYDGAALAAVHALGGYPRRPEAALAAAYTSFREGEIERSDSLFRAAIPRLDPTLARYFQDPTTLLGEGAPRNGWEGLDPDPTTPENEFQLEYWSRVAHAFLLFNDAERPGEDARLPIYVRYGAPLAAGTNPNGTPLYYRHPAARLAPSVGREATPGGNPGRIPMDFPTPIQVWAYPELGMRVVLQDRSLHGHYQSQATEDFDASSRPDPGILARRDDLLPLGDGVAVFHRLPPREQRIETEAVVARFEGAGSPRLLAQFDVPGGPADALLGRWVVSDLSGKIRARGEQRLAIAACDPTERRGAQFSADLPPGAYQVSISVQGDKGKRGLYQTRVSVEAGPPALALSDLVLACGDPTLLVGGSSARFDAKIDARSSGPAPLVAYLEIYRLAQAPDGVSHFEYQCDVLRAAPPEPRRKGRASADTGPLVSISREDTYVGAVRRQFVSVPVQSLRPGRYRLELRVHDQVADTWATRSTEFVRE